MKFGFYLMISYLEGSVKYKGANYLTILTGGIGYKVHVPLDIISHISLNSPISLYTYTYVKEDVLDLYGFPNQDDLTMFELLIGVSGVGPKTALAIFSRGKLPDIKEAIVKGDVEFFTSVPRLGRKNAQKIIIELRSKLGSLEDLDLTEGSSESKEIVDALKTFGFERGEAKDALKFIKDVEGSTSDKIRQALKYLGRK